MIHHFHTDLVAPVFNVTLTDHGTRVRYNSEIIPNNNGNFSTEIECVADPLPKDNNGECNITKATGNTASTFVRKAFFLVLFIFETG